MPSNSARALMALALIGVLHPVGTAAQTLFQAPDTTVTLARYTTVEDCLAAIVRIRKDLDRREQSMGADTMPGDPAEAIAPAPPTVTAMAARCAAPFTGATVDLPDFKAGLALLLAAGRDSDATTLIARRLAAVAPNDSASRSLVTDSTVEICVGARPTRLAMAEAILVDRARGSALRAGRLKPYATLLQASLVAGDTARVRRVAHWIVTLTDSLTATERQSDQFVDAQGQLLAFVATLKLAGLQPRLDSLRKSTAAFIALERSYWTRATGERGDAIPDIGKRAAVLTADYWFPSAAGSVPHPTPGTPALIVFVKVGTCIQQPEPGDFVGICNYSLAKLRRLARRFPTLKIDVVTWTEGAFTYVPPPTPANEAALQAQWLDSVRVPGAVLGVTSTPFLKLPEPDGRRIDRDMPNAVHYNLSRVPGYSSVFTTFLVDADGIVVEAGAPIVGPDNEAEEIRLIDALLRQPKGER